MNQREYNATANGQKDMANAASSIGVALMMNSKIKQLGGIGWDAAMIANANPTTLAAIKQDLLAEYNNLVTPCVPSQTT
jgi:hypothetical protein